MTRTFRCLLVAAAFPAIMTTTAAQETWARMTANGSYWYEGTGNATCFHPDGSVITAGVYTDSMDLDPGPGAFLLGTDAYPYGAMYIQRLDAGGQFVWAGSTSAAVEMTPLEIRTDAAGAVYVIGRYRGSVDFDPGPGVFTLNSANTYGNMVGFILKLDAGMNFLWAKKFGATPTSPSLIFASDLAIDDAGNLYLYGTFYQTMEFDGHTWTESSAHGFLIKLSPAGVFLWMKKIGFSNNWVEAAKLSVSPDGGFVLTGRFRGSPDFDPAPGQVHQLTSVAGSYDAFVLKLDASAAFEWVQGFGGTGPDAANYNRLDEQGNIYLAGTFDQTVALPGDDTLVAVNGPNVFVRKLTPAGAHLWAGSIPGNNDVVLGTIAVTGWGGLYLGGSFEGAADFDPGPASWQLATPDGDEDAFLCRFDSSGHLLWASSFGTHGDCWINDMGLRADGSFCLTGAAGINPSFQVGNYDYSLGSMWYWGSFVLRGFDCPPLATALNLDGCPGAVYNGITYDSTGYYEQVLTSSYGCDSVLQLNVVPHQPDTVFIAASFCNAFEYEGAVYESTGSYTQDIPLVSGCENVALLELTRISAGVVAVDDTLRATGAIPADAIFQWLDCQTQLPVPNAVLPDFLPASAGSYALVVHTSTCSDTSACFMYIPLSGAEQAPASAWRVWPNPFNEMLHIVAGEMAEPLEVILVSPAGQVMLARTLLPATVLTLPVEAPPGVYFLKAGQRWWRVIRGAW